MPSRVGIDFNRGFYYTDAEHRKKAKEYRDKHDYVKIAHCPLGTHERIRNLNIKLQPLLRELAEKYIKEKSLSS